MVAGINIRADFYSRDMQVDDDVGGAQITGSLIHQDILIRFQPLKPQALLLEQGMETRMLYRCFLPGNSITVSEYDELEIVRPTTHAFFGQRFRILKIQRDGLYPGDSRGYMELTLQRYSESGRTE